ncbi:hypothetical protein C7M84_017304 [Penaeus vannamei]|uniref:FAD-binding PCMH-type domain-containing protein n=1 Tax=Penaeus vannamei TaxID=6689 RepID=A0A3R7PZQ0_PENVA|nr:hypothetical protein C7M84_017304 [Penaeus vannamei]
MTDKVTFTINGVQHEIGADVTADTSLSTYLHAQHLRGTRVTCGTGGCGACVVLVTRPSPDTGEKMSYSALSIPQQTSPFHSSNTSIPTILLTLDSPLPFLQPLPPHSTHLQLSHFIPPTPLSPPLYSPLTLPFHSSNTSIPTFLLTIDSSNPSIPTILLTLDSAFPLLQHLYPPHSTHPRLSPSSSKPLIPHSITLLSPSIPPTPLSPSFYSPSTLPFRSSNPSIPLILLTLDSPLPLLQHLYPHHSTHPRLSPFRSSNPSIPTFYSPSIPPTPLSLPTHPRLPLPFLPLNPHHSTHPRLSPSIPPTPLSPSFYSPSTLPSIPPTPLSPPFYSPRLSPSIPPTPLSPHSTHSTLPFHSSNPSIPPFYSPSTLPFHSSNTSIPTFLLTLDSPLPFLQPLYPPHSTHPRLCPASTVPDPRARLQWLGDHDHRGSREPLRWLPRYPRPACGTLRYPVWLLLSWNGHEHVWDDSGEIQLDGFRRRGDPGRQPLSLHRIPPHRGRFQGRHCAGYRGKTFHAFVDCQPCKGRCSLKSADIKTSSCSKPSEKPESRLIQLRDATWHQPASLQELYSTLSDLPQGTKYRFVCSDTGKGIFHNEGPYSDYISTTSVPEFSRVAASSSGLVFGANVSISRMMSELSNASQSLSGFGFAEKIVKMWKRVGGTALRNMGSWAGNFAMKMAHKGFPSDVFLSLMAAGAVVKSGSPYGGDKEHTLDHLLDLDVEAERRVLLELRVPPLSDEVVFRLFKIAPRNANVHAYMNAAFSMRVDSANAHTVVGRPMILFGGINEEFLHAWGAEAALEDSSLEDEAIVQAALTALRDEIHPDDLPENPSAKYRVDLAQGLLYKTILGIVGDIADPSVASGASDLERPLASGQQNYDENADRWPLSKPVTKVEGHIQCSGNPRGRRICRDSGCDGREQHPGPAVAAPRTALRRGESLVLRPTLGLIVAKTAELSKQGAAAVVVTYDDIQAPVLTIEEAQQKPLPSPQGDPFVEGDVQAGFAASTHVLEGGVGHDWQYHFYMENQDDGLDVFTSSQWAIDRDAALHWPSPGVPDNTVNVSVKRIGGGFGGKITRGNIIAAATCLAARKMRKPVRTVLDMATCMTMLGGRDPFWSTYKVGVDAEGRLQAVQATMTSNAGYVNVDPNNTVSPPSVPSCYNCPNWEITPVTVLTNTPNNTWTRTPGTTEGVTLMETIIEHVAVALNLDPLLVRQRNLMSDGSFRRISEGVFRLRCGRGGQNAIAIPKQVKVERNIIGDMLTQLMSSADVENRKQMVDNFNKNHLWKKKGISVMTMLWPHVIPLVYPMNSLVSINQRDGTVAVSHGGTELGQGMNTKV